MCGTERSWSGPLHQQQDRTDIQGCFQATDQPARQRPQQNLSVQQRGDVTVDVKLEVGAVSESITVETTPVALELNTSTRDLTIETKMVRELPSNTRNPWQLAALDPTIINRGSARHMCRRATATQQQKTHTAKP